MRISDHILPVALFSLGLGLTTAHALDGTKSPDNIPGMPGVGVGVGPQSPPLSGGPANHSTSFVAQPGNIEAAVKALEVAFRSGDVVAGWKLGHMFADGGDGVAQDALRAFEYFRAIAENQRNVDATGLLAQIVANVHVELGRYYQTGIPNSGIKPDPVRAHLNFYYAANFGDPDAQYLLARTYLDGQGVAKDPRQGSRWLNAAATKGQYEAEATFGILLFRGLGQAVPRDPAEGLKWLKIAVETAPKGAAAGIQEIYNAAWEQATKDERASSAVLYEQWKRSKSAENAVHSP